LVAQLKSCPVTLTTVCLSTLTEIDHNFSKSHRIVTTSILPLVEQYGENSRAVWEASKVRFTPRTPFPQPSYFDIEDVTDSASIMLVLEAIL
jgi:hypothetical protein